MKRKEREGSSLKVNMVSIKTTLGDVQMAVVYIYQFFIVLKKYTGTKYSIWYTISYTFE